LLGLDVESAALQLNEVAHSLEIRFTQQALSLKVT
jgi:hypothetical protein